MSQRWSAIQHVSVSPTTIGDIVKSVLAMTQFERKMISRKLMRTINVQVARQMYLSCRTGVAAAVSDSFGFGGHNVALVLR